MQKNQIINYLKLSDPWELYELNATRYEIIKQVTEGQLRVRQSECGASYRNTNPNIA